MTQAIVFSADEGCDVGGDTGSPVSRTTVVRPAMNSIGTVKGVQLAIAEEAESLDHLVSPEEPSVSPWRGNKLRSASSPIGGCCLGLFVLSEGLRDVLA